MVDEIIDFVMSQLSNAEQKRSRKKNTNPGRLVLDGEIKLARRILEHISFLEEVGA